MLVVLALAAAIAARLTALERAMHDPAGRA